MSDFSCLECLRTEIVQCDLIKLSFFFNVFIYLYNPVGYSLSNLMTICHVIRLFKGNYYYSDVKVYETYS
jgi:hypothetical protein